MKQIRTPEQDTSARDVAPAAKSGDAAGLSSSPGGGAALYDFGADFGNSAAVQLLSDASGSGHAGACCCPTCSTDKMVDASSSSRDTGGSSGGGGSGGSSGSVKGVASSARSFSSDGGLFSMPVSFQIPASRSDGEESEEEMIPGQEGAVNGGAESGTLVQNEEFTNAAELCDAITGAVTHTGSISKGGVTLGGGLFGKTEASIRFVTLDYTHSGSTYNVTGSVTQDIKWATEASTGPGGQVDIVSDADNDLNATNYPTAASDLMPNMGDLGGRPPRTQFWAKDLTERHEKYHATDYRDAGNSAVSGANTWIGGQTANNETELLAVARTYMSRTISSWQSSMAAPASEQRAYGDGAGLYKSRSEAIKKKGDDGKYPTAAASPDGAAEGTGGGGESAGPGPVEGADFAAP